MFVMIEEIGLTEYDTNTTGMQQPLTLFSKSAVMHNSTFRYWLLSFINIVMPSRSICIVGWALN